MQIVVNGKLGKLSLWIACILLVICSISAFARQTPERPVRTLLLFPLDNTVGNTGAQVADGLNSFIRDSFGASPEFRVIPFSSRLPGIQRLSSAQTDRKLTINGPFSADQKALKNAVSIGKSMLVDMVIVGSIDSFSLKNDTAEIMVTASMLDPTTGKPIQTASVMGKAQGAVGIPEATVVAAAIKDAGMKIYTGLTGQAYRVAGQMASSKQGEKPTKKIPFVRVEEKRVIVFPFAASPELQSDVHATRNAKDMALLVKDGLSNKQGYSIVEFDANSPVVSDAVAKGKISIKNDDVIDATPDGISKAISYAKLIGAKYALLGSVDSYLYDPEKNELNMSASAQVIDVKTGKVRQLVKVSGKTVPTPGQEDISEPSLGISSTYDIATRLIAELDNVGTARLAEKEKPKKLSPVQARSVTVFPFALAENVMPIKYLYQHAEDLALLIKESINEKRGVSIIDFNPRLPTVSRAVLEQRISGRDTTAPIDTTSAGVAKVKRIGNIIGIDYAVIGSIDDYIYDENKGNIEMMITAQLINIDTGKIVNTVSVTGHGAGTPGSNGEAETSIGIAAIYDAAEKISKDLVAVNYN